MKLIDRFVSRELLVNVLFAIAVLSLVLVVGNIIGDTLRGNPKVHPELLVWFPNVFFLVLGAFLFRRLSEQ
jgi:lipopolysaccharide export LptBFGC system permease protein LptF